MINDFEIIWYGLQFLEGAPKIVFRTLQKYEKFYEQNSFFQKYVQRQIVDYFKADNVNFKN